MNTELYESLVKQIKEKLDDYAFIDIPKSVLEEVRSMLSNALFVNCKIKKDFDEKNYGAVMMAFYYETSRKYPAFNFLTPFYANFFDIGNNEIKIKSVVEKLKEDEKYYEAFFEIARVDVIKKVYAYAQKQIKSDKENKIFYQKIIEKTEDLGIEQKAIVIDSKPLNYGIVKEKIQTIEDSVDKIVTQQEDLLLEKSKSEELEDLYARKEELEKLAEQRKDGLFKEAALNLGVTKEEFEAETGGKDLNLDIDKVVIMPKVLKKVSPIKKLNQTGLKKLIEKNRRKRFLQSLDFDYVTRNNLNILIVKPMDTLFDKIASGDKPSIDSVIKNASRKEKMASSISFISYDEYSKIVRELAKSYDPKVASEYSDIISMVNGEEPVKDEYEDGFKLSEKEQTPEEFFASINERQETGYRRFEPKPNVPLNTTSNIFDSNIIPFNSEDYQDIIPEYKDGEPKFIIKPEDDGNEPGDDSAIDTGKPKK